ncbi:MAG: hypothetical protein M3Y60_10945, partial [Bacteroidota bacterium]|nr:hypothetical protein [Bacteroidota bacterium]
IPCIAQNLESIAGEKPFSFSGGISLNQILYASSGIAARRDPYRYFASGNINCSVYGWSIPLTFNHSNGNTSFTQPFNQFSCHPTWKWITLHAGYTSMSLSPYTVNGHLFSGGALELAPKGKWKFSALYGRFLKAIQPDTLRASQLQPAYQRTGYAMKTAYGDDQNRIELIVFHAEDDRASIGQPADSLHLTPQENLVVSVGGVKKLFAHLKLRTEFATSAITKDTRTEKTSQRNLLAKSGLLFQPRLSSAYYRAIKASLDYQHGQWLIGVGYERVDPEYRTLGAYYFNNDLENITLNSTAVIMKEKLNVALSAGIQHDNVAKNRISTMRRMVSALNITAAPSPRLNVSASWSSFQTYTNIRSPFAQVDELTPYNNADTLNFAQISRNAALSGNFVIGESATRKQNVNVNFSWQQGADSQGQQYSGSRFLNSNIGYTRSLLARNASIAFMFNTTIQESASMNSNIIAVTASMTKAFLNRKLRTMLSTSMSDFYSNGARVNRMLNCRITGVVAIRNKHSLNLAGVLVRRFSSRSTTELTASIGYHYSFGAP